MALKKIKKAARAVKRGTAEYAEFHRTVNKQAERLAGRSASRQYDIEQTGRIKREIVKASGNSLIKSIKRNYY